MRPTSFIAAAVTTVLLALAAAQPGCDSDDDATTPAPDSGAPTEAVPPDNLRACASDDECVKVGTSCRGCCEENAVNAASVTAYQSFQQTTCAGYQGGICGCIVPPTRVACVQKKCTLVPVDGGI